MTRITPLLERNEQFARTYTPAILGPAAAQVVIVTCLDHRVDPAIVLGLQLGDAPALVTPEGASPRRSSTTSPTSPSSPNSCSAAKPRLTRSSKSQSSITPNAAPAFSPTPASGTRPPRRPACPRRPSKPPPSPTRTPPSKPTWSACSPHPRCRRR